MPESIHDRIERERKAALPDAWKLRTFRDYTRGRQRGTLTREQYAALRSLLGNRFCDNVCKMILTRRAPGGCSSRALKWSIPRWSPGSRTSGC
jgi:hypothetical protein